LDHVAVRVVSEHENRVRQPKTKAKGKARND
jgi:hypothetical protein